MKKILVLNNLLFRLDRSGDLLFKRIDNHWVQVSENKHTIDVFMHSFILVRFVK